MNELRTLEKILRYAEENELCLFIPSYQRGYRWSPREVQELLSDIDDVDDASTDHYFLQLLAVREDYEDNQNKRLRIIDGQQRLTTALLILDCIEEDKHLVDGIKYETRDQNGELDKHFRDEATNTIQDWLYEKNDDEKQRFLRKIHNCEFLYFPIFDKNLEFDFFSRLNTWKISATDSELVKCFFLSDMGDSDPVDKDEINKRAILWNQMERQLSDNQFWGVFANSAEVEKDRMGFLLSSVPGIAEIDQKERFPLFKAYKDSRIKKSKLWSAMVKTFDWMRKWYGNKRTRHLVGWYLHRKGSSAHKISETLINEATQSTQEFVKDKHWLESPSLYYDSGDRLHDFLFLANVAWCSEKLGVDYDFFRHAQVGKWSIEHVHARNQQKLEVVEFKGLRFKPGRDPEQLWKEYDKLEKDAAAVFLQDNLLEECGYPKEDEDNSLGNLALLPNNANESLNNKLFVGKQRAIVSWALQGKGSCYWAPPLTVAMFVKEVGADKDKFKQYWSKADREAFATTAKNLVANYLQDVQKASKEEQHENNETV